MKLVFLPKDLSEKLLNYEFSEIDSAELEEILDELKQIDDKLVISDVNFGKGADWILLLAVLSSITYVITIGDKLEKGIDGWIKIGKRLSNIFKNSDRVYLDEEGAKIIAITHMSKKYELKSLSLIDSHTTYLVDFSSWFRQRKPECFTSKPFNIYNFTFNVNEERTLILNIKSNGQVIEILDIENEMLQLPF